MSGDESSPRSPRLTRSSSGTFRPSRRPPLNSSVNKSKMATKELPDFLVKESNFIKSTTPGQESLPELNDSSDSDDNDDKSVEESKEDNEDDQNYEDSSFEGPQPEAQEFRNISHKKIGVIVGKAHDQEEKKETNWFTEFLKKNCLLISIIFAIISIVIYCFPHILGLSNATNPIDLKTVKEKFSTQDEDLWTAFESGVEEIVIFNRPSTFILLYKEDAEKTLEHFLLVITKYAVCKIRDCDKSPIILTDTELNSSEIIEDYGRIIHKYRNKLQDNGVMVIKHLENVRGIAAQAFHSLCDEFTPLVKTSLFIFTMKVDDNEIENKMNFVENYFKNKWTEVSLDTLNALITRITSMVLEVKP